MEGYLREALDANVLRQKGDFLEFRHPLLREAAYDDLMPDERARIHGRLAEILQARVDAEPDPGLATLSRLAFHWNAAHDLPRTLAASVHARAARRRLGAAEAVTHLERALSLWDRVPDAEAVAGLRADRARRTSRASRHYAQGDHERWYALVRRRRRHARARHRPVAGQPRLLRAWPAASCSTDGHDRRGGGDPSRRRVRRRRPQRGARTCPDRLGHPAQLL